MADIKNKKTQQQYRRAYKNQSAGKLARALTEKAIRQKGFMKAEIVTKWRTIVGPEFEDTVMPLSLKFPMHKKLGATLEVRTHSAFAPLLQQSAHRIVEKINIYFGYGAVDKISITQGPMPKKKIRPQRKVRKLEQAEEQTIDKIVGEKGESDLGKAVKIMLTTVFETEK